MLTLEMTQDMPYRSVPAPFSFSVKDRASLAASEAMPVPPLLPNIPIASTSSIATSAALTSVVTPPTGRVPIKIKGLAFKKRSSLSSLLASESISIAVSSYCVVLCVRIWWTPDTMAKTDERCY